MLTCKGTLRLVFIRVYRPDIQSVMLVFFSTQICELLQCCTSNLLSGSILTSPPLPCVYKYIVYMYSVQCVWGGGGSMGLRQISTCRKVTLQVNFFYATKFCIAFYESYLASDPVLVF
jgi:hypothetical protein